MIPGVAEEAGAGADDACAWGERLGWTFSLIADDPAERAAALVHLAEARRKVADMLGRFNEIWRLTLPMGTQEQYREPAFVQAQRTYHQAQRRSLPDGRWCPTEWCNSDLRIVPGHEAAIAQLSE
jgi:hypothetical protein